MKNFLTVLVAIVIAISLSEIGLRVAGISYPVFDDYDPVRGFRLRPGKAGWYRKEGRAYIEINSLGYRDIEHPVTKPPGTFRIAVLGDSFTEARQVPRDEAFWSRLERDLHKCRLLDNLNIEVMNFGIGGYNTAQELLTLQDDVVRFAPDLVVLAFFAGNDVEGNSRALTERRGWKIQGPQYVFEGGDLVLDRAFRVPLWKRALYEGVQRFRLLELANEARRSWAVSRMQSSGRQSGGDLELGTSNNIYAAPADEAWREAWRITEALLLKIRNIAVENGAKFVVVTIPTSIQVHPDPIRRKMVEQQLKIFDLFYPDRRIAALGERRGFPVITLAERMQKLAEARGIYFHGFENTAWGTGHLNSHGHRVVGELLGAGICGPSVLGNSPVAR